MRRDSFGRWSVLVDVLAVESNDHCVLGVLSVLLDHAGCVSVDDLEHFRFAASQLALELLRNASNSPLASSSAFRPDRTEVCREPISAPESQSASSAFFDHELGFGVALPRFLQTAQFAGLRTSCSPGKLLPCQQDRRDARCCLLGQQLTAVS